MEPLKTQRVYLLLRDRIMSGELAPGDRLPGELNLAAQHEVSRVTVRLALDRLAGEQLIEKRAGAGTFVRAPRGKVRSVTTDVANVFAHLIEMGRTTNVRLLAFDYVAPSERVAHALRLESDERVQRSVRVRLVDDEPFSYLTAYVPERIGRSYSRDDLAKNALLELMERAGQRSEYATQEVSAMLASPEVADALELSIGSPLVSLTRVVYGASEEGMEYLHALYRPDRYSLQMNLVRTGAEGRRHWSPTSEPFQSEGASRPRTKKRVNKK